uniref:DUF4220 domain-containing protein n=1 Tax=Quercus lobata TaxID=97700 RepID=A0A7N2L4J1_QUELO
MGTFPIINVHQNRLWIPTLLLLLAGTIKYSERTIALYLASSDSFGTSVLKEPNPGPNYERLMRTYSHYEASNVPVQFVLSDEKKSDYLTYNVEEGFLTDMEHLRYAHRFANMHKGLIVNSCLAPMSMGRVEISSPEEIQKKH